MKPLFGEPLGVVNVGLGSFAEAIETAGGAVVQLDWQPPAHGDVEAARALGELINLPAVEAANAEAFARYQQARPVLEGVGVAAESLAGMGDRTILHAGPPIEWERMCGPMQGAIVGAILYEGWARDIRSAHALAAGGEIELAPCHDYGAVGPMAGIISPSMPLWIVANRERGNRAYSNLNEGLGKVLRFGANGPDVLERLRWMGSVLGPVLAAALDAAGGIELKPLMAQALHMGDELHNRNVAGSSLLFRRLLPAALATALPRDDVAAAAEFMTGNDHFFLNVSMAACKAMLDASAGVAGSSMVTAMSRNGVEFGIRMSGAGDRWFTTVAPVVDGLYFPGHSRDEAAPDLGDSSITESAGIGGFAMAASPAIVQFVGGTPRDAVANSVEMTHIVIGRNDAFTLPSLDFTGSPAGIDVRRVVDSGIAPIINTGIAHREAGIGQIGAGITRAPMAVFAAALKALAETLRRQARQSRKRR